MHITRWVAVYMRGDCGGQCGGGGVHGHDSREGGPLGAAKTQVVKSE